MRGRLEIMELIKGLREYLNDHKSGDGKLYGEGIMTGLLISLGDEVNEEDVLFQLNLVDSMRPIVKDFISDRNIT